MTRQRRIIVISCVLFVLFSAVSRAHAAEEGGSAANEQASELFKWINFAIVAGVIIWVFAKKLPPAFRRNAEHIGSAISKAAAAKAAAERLLKEAETKLARLEQEVSELRAAAQRDAVAEAELLRKLTQSDAEKIALAGKAEIEAAERAARLELKAIAAKLAVDGAESLLARQLTPATQEALVSNFVKSLEGGPN